MADNIIRTPGKFEGEPTYAEHFWDLIEFSETIYDGDTAIEAFKVNAEDVAAYPDLHDVEVVLLWCSDQGFIYSREMSLADLAQFRSECESDEYSGNEDAS